MKATIAGITYEGTYEEITAIVDRMTPQYHYNPNTPYFQFPLAPPKDGRDGCIPLMPQITSGDPPSSICIGGSTTSRINGCPASGGSCFCTGACQGKESATDTFMYSRTITI